MIAPSAKPLKVVEIELEPWLSMMVKTVPTLPVKVVESDKVALPRATVPPELTTI